MTVGPSHACAGVSHLPAALVNGFLNSTPNPVFHFVMKSVPSGGLRGSFQPRSSQSVVSDQQLVSNADSQAPPQTWIRKSRGEGPVNLTFNTLLWWFWCRLTLRGNIFQSHSHLIFQEKTTKAEVPNLFGSRDRFVEDRFSMDQGEGMALGWSGYSTFIVHWASFVAQLVKNLPAMQETWVRFLGWEDPLEKGKATHSSILA